ncbi:unnamed protein product [Caenorhabditis brenneri]
MQCITQEREDLESLHFDQKVADEEKKNVVKMFSLVKCQECKIYDLSPSFLENERYLAFEREKMLAYVDNSIHITGPGLELFKKEFEDSNKFFVWYNSVREDTFILKKRDGGKKEQGKG